MRRNPFLDVLAAVLPAAERDELIRRHGAEPYGWSAVLGVLEFYVGGRLLFGNALSYFQSATDALTHYVIDEKNLRPLETVEGARAVLLSGSVVWLTWLLRPLTWLLLSIPLVGMARLIAFGVSRDAVGEPLVWLVLRPAQAVLRRWRGLRNRQRFGPLRPDRVLPGRGSELVILSCQPKAEWNERITIEVGERFYRLRRVEERPDRGWLAHAYLLQEADPNEVFRGLVRYEAPPGSLG